MDHPHDIAIAIMQRHVHGEVLDATVGVNPAACQNVSLRFAAWLPHLFGIRAGHQLGFPTRFLGQEDIEPQQQGNKASPLAQDNKGLPMGKDKSEIDMSKLPCWALRLMPILGKLLRLLIVFS